MFLGRGLGLEGSGRGLPFMNSLSLMVVYTFCSLYMDSTSFQCDIYYTTEYNDNETSI